MKFYWNIPSSFIVDCIGCYLSLYELIQLVSCNQYWNQQLHHRATAWTSVELCFNSFSIVPDSSIISFIQRVRINGKKYNSEHFQFLLIPLAKMYWIKCLGLDYLNIDHLPMTSQYLVHLKHQYTLSWNFNGFETSTIETYRVSLQHCFNTVASRLQSFFCTPVSIFQTMLSFIGSGI
jgi:hypothetical protein